MHIRKLVTDSDPDFAFHFNTYPDSTLIFNADLVLDVDVDPVPYQIDGSLLPRVYIP